MGRKLLQRAVRVFDKRQSDLPCWITSGGLCHSYGLAVDAQNNLWMPNEDTSVCGGGVNRGLGSITTFNSSGQVTSGTTGYIAGGIYYPIAVAIDNNATTWVVNFGDSSLTLLSSTGQPLSGTNPYTLHPTRLSRRACHRRKPQRMGREHSEANTVAQRFSRWLPVHQL